MFTSGPPGNVRRMSPDMVVEAMRNFLMTLWNTYSFFVIYANIDNFVPEPGEIKPASELDRWLLSSLNKLVSDVDEMLDKYDPTTAGRRIESFVSDLSNWYVRRSRRRFWKSQNDDDKISAYNCLYRTLVTLSKLLAPFVPFVAEEMYQNLVRNVDEHAPESVHLAVFPVAESALIDDGIISDTELAMKVCSMGRAARSKSSVKVRQPLSKVVVKARSSSEREALKNLCSQILDELNVKDIEFTSEEISDSNIVSVAVDGDYQVGVITDITPELLSEGIAREIVRRLQTMRRSAGLEISDHINTTYDGSEQVEGVMVNFAEYIKQETLSTVLQNGKPGPGDYTEKFKLSGLEICLGIRKLPA
jgi:isoleucyl-tRNA synthetase